MERQIKKRATMKDVAQMAGVTIGTVSHVLNGTAPVAAETRERITDAIQELDYVLNPMARYMRSKKSYNIGMLIPNLNNDFHSKMTSVFVDCAYKTGFTVSLLGYEYSLEREKKGVQTLIQNNVDTIIIANGYDDEDCIKNIINRDIPLILADRTADRDDIYYIQFENRKVMFDLVKFLKEHGYRTLGFIAEPLKLTNLQDRYSGYVEALTYYGYQFNPDHVYISETLQLDNLRNGYRFMKGLLEKHSKEELPEAIIVTSDLLAIGIMRALNEYGYEVPGDFGIVGCDNIEVSGYTCPRLTTIEQDQIRFGEQLWDMVYNITCGNQIENIVLEQKLIIRESC